MCEHRLMARLQRLYRTAHIRLVCVCEQGSTSFLLGSMSQQSTPNNREGLQSFCTILSKILSLRLAIEKQSLFASNDNLQKRSPRLQTHRASFSPSNLHNNSLEQPTRRYYHTIPLTTIMSEEAELLRDMILDRDARIVRIQQKIEQLAVKEEKLKEELAQAAETNSQQIIQQQTVKTELLHDQQRVRQELQHLHKHLQRQNESLHEYVDYLLHQEQQRRGAMPAHDTQNVMRLQAQLCKAMHSVSIVDRQRELIQQANELLVKFQREALAGESADKAELERTLLNQLMERDTELRGVENKCKEELDVILNEMEALREQMDDSDSDSDKEDQDEESEVEEEELDEEEKAAKEEMMKLLQQRREEIKKLEAEIEEREEFIEELQIREEEKAHHDEAAAKAAAAAAANGSTVDLATTSAKPQVAAPAQKPPTTRKEEKKEEPPVDEIAARLQQVMANASDTKVEEVDELDLLKLAQSRLTGGGDAGKGEDEDDDSEEDSETESGLEESYSESMDPSDSAAALN